MARILLCDDDTELCALLAQALTRDGFEPRAVHDGAALLAALDDPHWTPDAVVLDVMMPGPDGLATLTRLRARHGVPVLMLSARGEPVDRIVGLELGADDYLPKPCVPRELTARLRALLRRGPRGFPDDLTVGTLTVSPRTRSARVGSVDLTLTAAEYEILALLAAEAGRVVTKDRLSRAALGRPLGRFERSVDVHVSRLRGKLAHAGAQAPGLEAQRNVGYVLTAGHG